MSEKQAELLLAAVITARSTSYVLSKTLMNDMGPMTLMAVRFLLAFGILAVIFCKKLRRLRRSAVFSGLALGGLYFAVMAAELLGLQTTSSSTTSFLENTAVVFVPVFSALLYRRLPEKKILASAAVTLFGVGFLTLKESGIQFTAGELLCLAAAVLYAFAIILTDRLAQREDPLTLGILQLGCMGFLGLVGAFLFETPHLPAGTGQWAAMAGLAVVCSCFGFTLQPVAQKYTTAERAGVFCALNPLAAGAMGSVFLGETLSPLALLGAGLVICGILIAVYPAKSKSPSVL